MKKGWLLLLALIVLLSFTACGKSEAVVKVEELISAIGEVTLESKSGIDSAQQAFDALPENEKGEVENYFQLVEKQNALKQLEELEEQRRLEEQEKAKEAYAKEAYDHIQTAWKIADQIGNDLYNVWHGCIWKKEDMAAKGVQFFIDETELSEKEIVEGLASRYYVNLQYASTGILWNDLSENDKQAYRTAATDAIKKASRADQYMGMNDALGSVVNAYKLNGKLYAAQEALSAAKQALKELPEDYKSYPQLKGFFKTANALTEYCSSPTGSYDQYKILLNDYRKEARAFETDLDFIFED